MDTEKLIDAIRSFPVLWDGSTCKGKSDRENAWKKVAPEVGDGTTVEQCSKKWKNLRDQFVREIKKEKEPQFVSSWKFYEKMSFLKGSVSHRGFMKSDDGESVQEEETETDINKSMVDTEVSSPSDASSSCSTSTTTSDTSITTEQYHQQNSKRRKLNIEKGIGDGICKEVTYIIDMTKSSEMASYNKADTSFAKHVLERLNKMEPRQKAIAQAKIQQILVDVEFSDHEPISTSQSQSVSQCPPHHTLSAPRPPIIGPQRQPMFNTQQPILSPHQWPPMRNIQQHMSGFQQRPTYSFQRPPLSSVRQPTLHRQSNGMFNFPNQSMFPPVQNSQHQPLPLQQQPIPFSQQPMLDSQLMPSSESQRSSLDFQPVQIPTSSSQQSSLDFQQVPNSTSQPSLHGPDSQQEHNSLSQPLLSE